MEKEELIEYAIRTSNAIKEEFKQELIDYYYEQLTQLKKQKEIIDKIKKEINEQHTIMGCEVVENWVLLQILEDKGE